MKNKKIKKGLTPKMKKILHEIQAFSESNGYSPSYEELKQLIGLKSKSNIHRYVHTLKKRGYLDDIPYSKRSIVLL